MRYIPFLKLKSNEVMALEDLKSDVLANITPLFDIPRTKDMNDSDFIERVRIALKSLNAHWDNDKTFYIDVFDITPTLKPKGNNIYKYTLDNFSQFKIIPVVGLDRDQTHLDSVIDFLKKKSKNGKVAIRLLPSDFSNYDAVAAEIDESLGDIINSVKNVDLLLDARILTRDSVNRIANDAGNFVSKFTSKYKVRRIVLSGSSIPSSISDIVGTNGGARLTRLEKQLWIAFNSKCKLNNVALGDYGLVSPEYSDIDLDPKMFPNIMSPKIIYTYNSDYYAVRGAAFKTHPQGYDQYFDLAQKVATKPFFRGSSFSAGDKYVYQRSLRRGTHGSPGSWIKVTVNAHLSFVGQEVAAIL